MAEKNKGLECKPGDRGDATQHAGLAKLTSGASGTLKGEVSKGYEPVTIGWAGKVRR
uniref:Uncharacterized protein n=1 Tax=viral metagenome TaxID=1070528 RepID=A0A6H1ZF66_9ZZZZ